MAFQSNLSKLVAALDPTHHEAEIKTLVSCRRLADLEWLAENDGGWLSPSRQKKRLKLVRHGSGTFLVVAYEDGWSSTLSQAPFPKARR